MIVLAIDTSAEVGSLALLHDGKLLAERAISARMQHAAQIFPQLDELLAAAGASLADIELFAVGIGPGSFNGIRVSIAAVKGLRLASKKPMVGISSADAIAHDAV